MFTSGKILASGITALIIAAGTQNGANENKTEFKIEGNPLRCEIHTTVGFSKTTLIGKVYASTPLHGSYQLHFKSSGRGGTSNISQSGEFEVNPKHPAKLGKVVFSNRDKTYDADLKIYVDGRMIDCNAPSVLKL